MSFQINTVQQSESWYEWSCKIWNNKQDPREMLSQVNRRAPIETEDLTDLHLSTRKGRVLCCGTAVYLGTKFLLTDVITIFRTMWDGCLYAYQGDEQRKTSLMRNAKASVILPFGQAFVILRLFAGLFIPSAAIAPKPSKEDELLELLFNSPTTDSPTNRKLSKKELLDQLFLKSPNLPKEELLEMVLNSPTTDSPTNRKLIKKEYLEQLLLKLINILKDEKGELALLCTKV